MRGRRDRSRRLGWAEGRCVGRGYCSHGGGKKTYRKRARRPPQKKKNFALEIFIARFGKV